MKCCQTCALHTNKPQSKCTLTGKNVGRKSFPCTTADNPAGVYERSNVALARLAKHNRIVKENYNG